MNKNSETQSVRMIFSEKEFSLNLINQGIDWHVMELDADDKILSATARKVNSRSAEMIIQYITPQKKERDASKRAFFYTVPLGANFFLNEIGEYLSTLWIDEKKEFLVFYKIENI